jgi:hypothetical protein
MTIRIVKGTPPWPIGHLVVDYLASCQARGLVPRSLKQYAYALEAVFLPWCEREGITDIESWSQPMLPRSQLPKSATPRRTPNSGSADQTSPRRVR